MPVYAKEYQHLLEVEDGTTVFDGVEVPASSDKSAYLDHLRVMLLLEDFEDGDIISLSAKLYRNKEDAPDLESKTLQVSYSEIGGENFIGWFSLPFKKLFIAQEPYLLALTISRTGDFTVSVCAEQDSTPANLAGEVDPQVPRLEFHVREVLRDEL